MVRGPRGAVRISGGVMRGPRRMGRGRLSA
jgi:hypothetical protein